MANPDGMKFCRVEGRFRAFVADGTDPGDDPEFIPMSGTVTFTANIANARNVTAGVEEMYFPQPVVTTLDADGDLSLNGQKFVHLLCPSEAIRPESWNWTATFRVKLPNGQPVRNYGPFPFDVVPDGTVDLAVALPVPAANGTWAVIGPAGPAGPTGAAGATGPEGPQGLTGPAGVDGADGSNGLDGAMGPQGPIGLTGPAGADGSDGSIGPQGIQGLTGPEGPAGPTGPAGPQGPAGADGLDGADGATGPAGPQGPAGADGAGGTGDLPSNLMRYRGPWVATPIIPQVVDFESGSVPATWNVASPGLVSVVAVADAVGGKTKAMRMGPPAAVSNNDVSFTVDWPDSSPLLVRYSVSSEGNFDLFRVIVDGVYQNSDSGVGGGWEQFSVAMTPGAHTVLFRYAKDGNGNGGTDDVHISMVTLRALDPSDPYTAGHVVTHSGTDWILHGVSTTQTPGAGSDWTSYTGATGATGPAGPQGIQGIQGIQGPAGADGTGGSATLPSGLMRYRGTWVAAGAPAPQPITFESGTLPAGWVASPSGMVSIVDKPDVTGGTTKALRLTGTASTTTSVTLPSQQWPDTGGLIIRWYMSSEANDKFQIVVDGTILGQDQGNPGTWQQVTLPMTAGPRDIVLKYVKNAAADGGTDDVHISLVTLRSTAGADPYDTGDVVTYGGKDWILHTASTSQTPGTGTDWYSLTGATGPAGTGGGSGPTTPVTLGTVSGTTSTSTYASATTTVNVTTPVTLTALGVSFADAGTYALHINGVQVSSLTIGTSGYASFTGLSVAMPVGANEVKLVPTAAKRFRYSSVASIQNSVLGLSMTAAGWVEVPGNYTLSHVYDLLMPTPVPSAAYSLAFGG